jgi:hypothetical protein
MGAASEPGEGLTSTCPDVAHGSRFPASWSARGVPPGRHHEGVMKATSPLLIDIGTRAPLREDREELELWSDDVHGARLTCRGQVTADPPE